MIGRAMEKWPSVALRRVVDAPIEAWSTREFALFEGTRCLVGHAAGMRPNYRVEDIDRAFELLKGGWKVPFGFDKLCDRFGLPRMVRAVKIRALKVLDARAASEAAPSSTDSAAVSVA